MLTNKIKTHVYKFIKYIGKLDNSFNIIYFYLSTSELYLIFFFLIKNVMLLNNHINLIILIKILNTNSPLLYNDMW